MNLMMIYQRGKSDKGFKNMCPINSVISKPTSITYIKFTHIYFIKLPLTFCILQQRRNFDFPVYLMLVGTV